MKKTIIKSLGYTIISILIINIISLFIAYLNVEKFETLTYKHGMFFLNDKSVGMNFSEVKYWIFYIIIFIISFLYLKKISNK